MDKKKKRVPRWRVLSSILVLCMVLTALPVTPLWAAEETESANRLIEKSDEDVNKSLEIIEDPEVDKNSENSGDAGTDSQIAENLSKPKKTSELPNDEITQNNKLEEIVLEERVQSYYGYCGDNVLWTLDNNGTLTIRGTGDIYDCPSGKYLFMSDGSFGGSLNQATKTVIIQKGVTSIGEYAFHDFQHLTSVEIADSVTNIGARAFYRCDALVDITIPNSVVSIGTKAFWDCENLTDITIPNSVTSLGESTFEGCRRLISAIISANITEIKNNTFKDCRRLRCVYIPDSVKNIGENVFMNCCLNCICYGGDEKKWESIEAVSPKPTGAIICYNSTSTDHKIYRGDSDYEIFDRSLEMCMYKTPSSVYNPQLAHMLIAMCNSVYDETNIKETFKSFGFEDADTITNYGLLGDGIFLAYGMTKKKLSNGKTLVLVVARGSDDFEDWISNFDPRVDLATSQHKGFSDAANALYSQMSDFLGTTDLSNAEFVITGFSRGAAAANILAKKLVDEKVAQIQIYAYTFACPDVVLYPDKAVGSYGCIFNIANAQDKVSWFPGGAWKKYGLSYWYSDIWNDYENLKRNWSVHNQASYLEYLRSEKSQNEYKERNMTETALDDAAKKRDEKFWNAVHNTALSILGCTSVYCPVNVEVYDSRNQLVGKVEYGLISDVNTDKIYISVTDDKKDIYMLDDDTYSFRLTATDKGTMNFAVKKILVSDRSILESKDFTSVTLTKGKQMTSKVSVLNDNNGAPGDENKTDLQEVKLLVLDDKGDPDKEVLPDGKGTEVDVDAPSISPSPSGKPRPSTAPGSGDRKPAVKVKSIKITGSAKKIAAGKKIALKAVVSPSNAKNKAVTWKSSNTKYATVNSKGVVTIKKAARGKTVIITATAKDGSKKKASYKIQCMKGIVKKVAISGKKVRNIKTGKIIKLKAIIKATKGANKALRWSSSNTKYATVNSKGRVTTKKAGKGKTVTITAAATDGSGKKAVIKIKLK